MVNCLSSLFCTCFQPNQEPGAEVRVYFLSENHRDSKDRKKIISFLNQHYMYERGDILLIEDDEQKSFQRMDGVKVRKIRVEGWDSHESCIQRQKVTRALKKISQAIHEAERGIHYEKNLDFLSLVARSKLKNNHYDESRLLLSSCKEYIHKVSETISFEHFTLRQESLINKIKDCYYRSESGHIFVITGKNHLAVNHPSLTISNAANELLTSFKDRYVIV